MIQSNAGLSVRIRFSCLHYKLYQRNFAFLKFSCNRNFAYVNTKFRKDLREISCHSTKVRGCSCEISLRNFVAKFRRTFARTKDEIRRTSLLFLLHSTVQIYIQNCCKITIKKSFSSRSVVSSRFLR